MLSISSYTSVSIRLGVYILREIRVENYEYMYVHIANDICTRAADMHIVHIRALSTYFAPTIQTGIISARSDFDAINAKIISTYISDVKHHNVK